MSQYSSLEDDLTTLILSRNLRSRARSVRLLVQVLYGGGFLGRVPRPLHRTSQETGCRDGDWVNSRLAGILTGDNIAYRDNLRVTSRMFDRLVDLVGGHLRLGQSTDANARVQAAAVSRVAFVWQHASMCLRMVGLYAMRHTSLMRA